MSSYILCHREGSKDLIREKKRSSIQIIKGSKLDAPELNGEIAIPFR